MSRPLQGTVNLPGGKSESNRALMIAAYGGFPLEVNGLSDAHDTVLLKQLLELTSLLRSARNDVVVDCEDAGAVARFMLTYLANRPGTWTLTGTPRLCERPMAPLIDALQQLDAAIIASEAKQSSQNSLPLKIVGKPITGGSVTLDASQSSQFASSLLLAAPTWERGLQLTLKGNPVSMPYLEMTTKMMEHFGARVIREGNTITVPNQSYQPRPFSVSPDWSAASYWYEMMALSDGGDLLLKGLKPTSLQGDAIVAEWFKPLGVITTFESDGARLAKMPADPQNLVFDFTDHPDLFPAVFVTCVAKQYHVRFHGIKNLSIKESNRVDSLISELSKIYTFINIYNDDEIVIQKSVFNKDFIHNKKVIFNTYQDHRIAMALAPLSLSYPWILFDDTTVVSKSYPMFWEEMRKNCGLY